MIPHGSPSTFHDRVLNVLLGIAHGDAISEDIVSALRNEGISSLDELITALVQVERERRDDPRSLPDPINLHRPLNPTPTHSASSMAHSVPELPFVLNGTLYDPRDMERFNGRELHFVPAPRRDHILVIDNESVMVRFWQLSYLSAIGAAAQRSPTPQDMSAPQEHRDALLPFAEFHEDVEFPRR